MFALDAVDATREGDRAEEAVTAPGLLDKGWNEKHATGSLTLWRLTRLKQNTSGDLPNRKKLRAKVVLNLSDTLKRRCRRPKIAFMQRAAGFGFLVAAPQGDLPILVEMRGGPNCVGA